MELSRKISRISSIDDNEEDNKIISLNYLKTKVPIVAGNFGTILQLKDEMTNLVDNLDSKINEKISKDESQLISEYNNEMNNIKTEINSVKKAYNDLEKDTFTYVYI